MTRPDRRYRFLAVVTGLVVAGCATDRPHTPLANALRSAMCAGHYDDAVSRAGDARRAGQIDPHSELLHAYALERSGRVMAARPVYGVLEGSRVRDPITVSCGSTTVLEGEIADIARKRLNRINARLSSMGVTLAQLASLTPIVADVAAEPAPPQIRPAAAVAPPTPEQPIAAAPKTEPPKPRFWAHLASYRSRDRAAKGWAELRRKHHPLLEGCALHLTDIRPRNRDGVFYRMGCRGFVSLDEGRWLCAQLKKSGQYCIPRRVTQ